MNREEKLTKSMLDMANGAIKERVDVEMPKIIRNIMDVNTNATKPRKMTLTLTFTPDEQRQVIATKCEIKSSLQPTNPVTTSLYIGEFAGEVQAVEMKPQGYPRYYYPVSEVDRAVRDILDNRRARIHRYNKVMEEFRLRQAHEKGFWQQAVLVTGKEKVDV